MFASCITRVQLYVNTCNWMAAVCAAAPLALANQLPLPRLYSALDWSSRKLRYIRIRPLHLPFTGQLVYMPTRRLLSLWTGQLDKQSSGGRSNSRLVNLQMPPQTLAVASFCEYFGFCVVWHRCIYVLMVSLSLIVTTMCEC